MRNGVVWAVVCLAGCTRPNPRACNDGVCSDPSYPFCDTQGSLGGETNECIAVTCTPREFAECRDDEAIVCNEDGTNYEARSCVNGCDPRIGCTFESSNNLNVYLDMASTLEDVDLEDAQIDVTTGTLNGSDAVPSWLLIDESRSAVLRVFVVNRLTLRGATKIFASARVNATPNATTATNVAPAVAILSARAISVLGSVTFVTTDEVDALPGSVDGTEDDSCIGARGNGAGGTVGSSLVVWLGGNGGGGHATAGAPGGTVHDDPAMGEQAGGSGGAPAGNAQLVPLRGGCSSMSHRGGWGGGALQLSSFGPLRIDAKVDARGGNGASFISIDAPNMTFDASISGGGGGGGILLEAPYVEITSGARLLAGGGAGGARDTTGTLVEDGAAAGAVCVLPDCGDGGNGAADGTSATAGEDATYDGSENHVTAGGGGGGIGRVRINTDPNGLSRAGSFINASFTEGVLLR